MKFKPNTLVIFNSYAQTVFDKVDAVWKEVVGTDATLTGGLEGSHSGNSLHYRGLAWDFRLPVSSTVTSKIMAALKVVLPPSTHDVLLEGDHIHVEYDPKP